MGGDASWLDSMPEIYDRCLGPAVFEPFARLVGGMVAALHPATVLELAAGTGIVTRELVTRLPGAAITATDLNPAMVEWGAGRVTGATWQVADAQQLPFEDASFDVAVCQFGVMFFPDRPAAVAETARVLRPGGTFVFTAWDRIEGSQLPARVEQAFARVLADSPPDFMSRIPHGYCDPDQIRRDVVAGGLEVVQLEHVVLRGSAESAASVVEGFGLGTPLRFQLAERGELPQLVAAAAAELTAELGAGPVEGELAAFVVSARRPD
jgi:SAM-dependent methyltransferase